MEKRRLKNAKATALAASYGVSLEQAAKAVEDGAPKPTTPVEPADLAEARSEPAVQVPAPSQASAPAGRFLTSVELANERHMSRDQMEMLLRRMGLRNDGHDGTTRYDESLLGQRLIEEDITRFGGIVELVTAFTSNAGLKEKIIREMYAEAVERWITENDLRAEIADLKKAIWAQFCKSHAYQSAKRAGDSWGELAALQEFGTALLAADSAAQPKAETQGDTTDVRV